MNELALQVHTRKEAFSSLFLKLLVAKLYKVFLFVFVMLRTEPMVSHILARRGLYGGAAFSSPKGGCTLYTRLPSDSLV